jgi:hypothetical protein
MFAISASAPTLSNPRRRTPVVPKWLTLSRFRYAARPGAGTRRRRTDLSRRPLGLLAAQGA